MPYFPLRAGDYKKGYIMDEDTTTNASVADGGSSIDGIAVDEQGLAITDTESQPEETETKAVAVETPEEPSQEAPETPEEPVKADNSKSEWQDWLEKKGIDPNAPEAVEKLAEIARNSEKKMHESAQKASELEKVTKITDEQIPVDASPSQVDTIRARNLELRMDIRDWKDANRDKMDYEPAMVKVLSDPVKKQLVQEGYLTLDDVYGIAKGTDIGRDEIVKSQGKREALESLAQKQQAAVPVGNAVNPSGGSASKITPQNVNDLVGKNDQKWFEANYQAINEAMSQTR